MNSSIDRPNTFRTLAGLASFTAFALVLGSTFAVAQEGQPVPKTTVPKSAPAPAGAAPVAAPGATAAAEEFSLGEALS